MPRQETEIGKSPHAVTALSEIQCRIHEFVAETSSQYHLSIQFRNDYIYELGSYTTLKRL